MFETKFHFSIFFRSCKILIFVIQNHKNYFKLSTCNIQKQVLFNMYWSNKLSFLKIQITTVENSKVRRNNWYRQDTKTQKHYIKATINTQLRLGKIISTPQQRNPKENHEIHYILCIHYNKSYVGNTNRPINTKYNTPPLNYGKL